MKTRRLLFAPVVFVAMGVAALVAPVPVGAAGSSDHAFNQMVGEMAGKDTGSGWFDYYVAVLNQEIASKAEEQAFGAAGPNGPLSGFDGYMNGFVDPDTGSIWFNGYVDDLNRMLRERAQ